MSIIGGILYNSPCIFSYDNKYLFYIESSKIIVVLNRHNGQIIQRLKGHSNKITQVLIDPNNRMRLISCSLDKTIKIWDFMDGINLYTINNINYPIYHMNIIKKTNEYILCIKYKYKYHIVKYNAINIDNDVEANDKKRKFKKLYKNTNKIIQMIQYKDITASICESSNILTIYFHNTEKVIKLAHSNHFSCLAIHESDG